MPGGDTTKKVWTDREKALAIRGIIPPGRTRNQTSQMRTKLKRIGYAKITMEMESDRQFTAEEDLMVVDSEIPDGRTADECRHRFEFLKKNFIDVGWASIIGTQKIYEMQ